MGFGLEVAYSFMPVSFRFINTVCVYDSQGSEECDSRSQTTLSLPASEIAVLMLFDLLGRDLCQCLLLTFTVMCLSIKPA